MSAQRIERRPLAHQPVQALEALAPVGGPRREVDPRRRSPAEHAQLRSSTASHWTSVCASNPRPTSIRRPAVRAIARPLAAAAAQPKPALAISTATQRSAAKLPASAGRASFRYRANVARLTRCNRQNSSRVSPQASNSANNRPASARLRRRRRPPNACTCSSIPPLDRGTRATEQMDCSDAYEQEGALVRPLGIIFATALGATPGSIRNFHLLSIKNKPPSSDMHECRQSGYPDLPLHRETRQIVFAATVSEVRPVNRLAVMDATRGLRSWGQICNYARSFWPWPC